MNFIANESPTKLRGGYYTPPDIARFLTRWVFETNPDFILEPSCGDGIFLDAINHVNGNAARVIAVERDAEEAGKARQRAADLGQSKTQVILEDFIKWGLLNISQPAKFDAVLGNPPFIRYQYLDNAQQVLMEKVFQLFHLPFTKHTNAWVPFIILSIAHLKAGGRLGMVVPSEILHVLHAQPLRTFLASTCSKIQVIDPEELWFGETLQGVVLLLAEKKVSESAPEQGVAITQVRDRRFLEKNPSDMFNQASYLNGEVIKGKWMLGLLSQSQRDLLGDIVQRPTVTRFKQLASVDVGIVTGANKFFLVTDATVAEYELKDWVHPMFGRSEHAPGVVYGLDTHAANKEVGFPTNFLWFQETEIAKYPQRVQEYIKQGESDGLHRRYKCRVRTPWFKVPSVYTTPVGMLKRCHDYPRLILNRANAYTTDTAYRILPKAIAAERFVYSFINSLTALSAELEGRHYGGGVLELVPSEIERLIIPTVEVPVLIGDLDRLIRAGTPAEKLLARQNQIILGGIGVSQAEQDTLLDAWDHLRSRRQRSQSKARLAAVAVSR
ncbi:MAG TPA: class I SAM-dependent methyltransferase [Blastocatellia bacterium]|nr:class I SAM-dependent methyltransferase [Blastocatellia bacterium]